MKTPPAWTARLSPAAAACLDVALSGMGRADLSPMSHDYAQEQADLQTRYWCDEAANLRGTGAIPERSHTQPPASANAELRANPISHP